MRHIPDLMASLASLNEGSVRQIRKTTDSRISVLDVIGAATGSSPTVCSHTWNRLQEAFPEVGSVASNFKFPGQGQRETPVTDARGIVEIVMILPGRAAASVRKQAASVLVRYLGGDPSLVEEIADNRLAQARLPEDHPMRLFGETVESEAIKRKREELQMIELEGQIKKARVQAVVDTVTLGAQALEALGLRMDDRDRIRAKDLISQVTFGGEPSREGELCVRKFVLDRGRRQFGMDARVGKLAKKLYLRDHPEYTFPKKDVNVNGQIMPCNVWYESQRDYLERALTEIGSS
jgi:hypothetical protein